MQTLNDLLTSLEACKGSDRWRRIAAHAGIHYDTLARIARGKLEAPSFEIVRKVFIAIEATEPAPESKAAA